MSGAADSERRQLDAELRDVHAEIGRLRRRLDRRASSLVDRSLLFASWRDFVAQHPGRSLFAAAGAGMALAGVATRGAKTAESGAKIYDSALSAAWVGLWDEVVSVVKSQTSSADHVEQEDE